MIEYLNKYPKQKQDIDALLFTFGIDKANSICKEALFKNKKIELITDASAIDF